MDREPRDLRRELAGVERGRGRWYPDDLRLRIGRWCRRRRAEGASLRVLAIELGVSPESLHVWFADERMVAPGDGESTYGQVQRAWKSAGVAQAALLHRIEGEFGGIEGSRRATLELHIHAGAKPRFELAILGLDADGNVGGLFPDDSGLRAGGFYFPARGGTHVTATVPLLSAARHLVYVAVAPPWPRREAHARRPGDDVTWILDRESTSQLPVYKVGGIVRLNATDLDAWLERQRDRTIARDADSARFRLHGFRPV